MQPFEENSPFYKFNISSHSPLEQIKERYNCEECGKSSRYFCYRCVQVAPSLTLPPPITLPLPLTILKDSRELDGKSTAVHAKLLAPSSTDIFIFDCKKDNGCIISTNSNSDVSSFNLDKCAILFPNENAKSVNEVDWSIIKRLIVIDGTWQQAKAMLQTPFFTKSTSVQYVKLSCNYKTAFWRYQNIGPHCLSTIEAIYYFYREYCQVNSLNIPNQLDDLLYFFSFFHCLIQKEYTITHPQRKFTTKHPNSHQFKPQSE